MWYFGCVCGFGCVYGCILNDINLSECDFGWYLIFTSNLARKQKNFFPYMLRPLAHASFFLNMRPLLRGPSPRKI